MTQTRRTAALLFLVVLFVLAAQIGNSLKQILMIFSIFMWVVAAGMFVYLILFRGARITLFSRNSEPANEKNADMNSDVAVDGAEIVPLHPPVQ